jgi:signal transduction histidine kinase
MSRCAPSLPHGHGPAQLDWGTHYCQLYRTQEDLVQVLVPFFRTGLEAGEQCLWITAQPLPAQEAKRALRREIPDLESRLARGQIEIIDHADWYTRTGHLNVDEVIAAWLIREQHALESGYSGLRLSGNTFWLERDDWESFSQYEAAVHAAFADRRIIALCSYSLDRCRSDEVVDVLRNHSFALTRREGDWEVVHNATTMLGWLHEASAALEDETARARRLEAERSEISRAEREARVSAQAAREHLSRLQRVTAALSPAATIADIGRVVVNEMAEALEADMAILAVPTHGDADLMLIDHAGLQKETTDQFAVFPVTTPLPIAHVYREGVTEWLPTPQAIAARYPDLGGASSRSRAIGCAPLVVGGRRLGAVGFGYVSPRALTPEHRALFDDLAKQVALAIERARLYEDTRRARDRLQLLSDAASRLATGKLDLDDVLDALTDTVTRHIADCCAIALRHEHAEFLQVAALRHIDPEVERELRETSSAPIELGHGVTGQVADTGEAVWIPTLDPTVFAGLSPCDCEQGEPHRIRSLIVVPLRASGAVIGVLSAARYETHEPFQKDDRDLLQDLAARAALAIDNARLYARAQDASRRKDEFLAVLGHELRNPLSPIVTALELMKMRGNHGSRREREVIERQVLHVRRLVDDLLDVSRITRGMIELRKERVSLDSMIERALETTSPLVEQRGHRVHVCPCLEPVTIEVDPMRFSQILVNLLSNAARYTDVGGRIDVICKRHGERVSISVRDSGVGISPEALPTIFDAFVQVQRNVEAAQGGLGLGLALVKSLVELHGGTVTVRSEGRGKGSEFAISLPAVVDATAAESGRDLDRESHADGRRRILVVDDNPDAADSLGDLLRALGHEVVIAYDAPQALACAVEFPLEIAVLDIGLPVMDGYELGHRLQEQSQGPIRLIAVTGYGTDADRERSRVAGFDAHLTKPVEIDTLLERITA